MFFLIYLSKFNVFLFTIKYSLFIAWLRLKLHLQHQFLGGGNVARNIRENNNNGRKWILCGYFVTFADQNIKH